MLSLEYLGGFKAMGDPKRFKQHPQAICTELDGHIALFQSSTCDYLVLNETGSAIWNALTTQPTLSQLCSTLQQEFSVSPSECIADVQAWLETGIQKQVVIAFEGN